LIGYDVEKELIALTTKEGDVHSVNLAVVMFDDGEKGGTPSQAACCPRCEFPFYDCLCHPQFMA
jgi:hypothetical protein